MSRRDAVVLLLLAIITLAFVAYEIAGLELPGWHTVSFLAVHNHALAVGIGVALALSGPVAAAWWIHHLRTRIPR